MRRRRLKNLARKIRDTRLFSDPQKVELLVILEEASAEDKKKLEAGIDAFDREYKAAVVKHTAQIRSLLGHALKDMTEEERKLNQDAIDELKMGLTLLTPAN